MSITRSIDLFGHALYNFWKKDKTPIYFTYQGNKKARSVKRYFRPPSKLSKLEKKLISLCFGQILDIGCATGYYIPALMKQGTVEAIDISPYAVRVANEKGLNNCHCANIFNFHPNKLYDTITLFENNLGLGGSIENVEKLLKVIMSLMKPDGQVLLHQRNITEPWHKSELTVEYKGQQETFNWLHISSQKIEEICKQLSLKFEIIDKGRQQMYLAKISKSWENKHPPC